MQNNKKSPIINLLPVILCFLYFAALTTVALVFFKEHTLSVILLIFLGLIIHYVFGVIFHELGHVIAAKTQKMQVVYVNFGLFSYDKEQKKLRLFTFLGQHAGESKFLPTKKVTDIQLKTVTYGGLIGSLTYIFICTLVLSFVKNYATIAFFGAGQTLSLYLFIVNILPLGKNYDGSLIFNNDEYLKAVAACAEVQRLIINGETPVEPDDIKGNNQPIARYFHYLFLATNNNKEVALSSINNLDCNDAFTEDEYNLIFPELLFKACIENTVNEQQKQQAYDYFSDEHKNINALRAHYFYRLFTGENSWAQILCESYKKQVLLEPPFIIKTEQALTQNTPLSF